MEQFLNPEVLIKTFGYVGFFLAVFAESGVLVGVLLPGDSLLITAGLFAASGFFSLPILIIGGIVAAILGDTVGYQTGKYFGPRLFSREESLFFKRRYVEEASAYFKKHGPKSIVVGRFVPIVRTFVPIVAGMGRMPYKTFFLWNTFGGVLWVASLLILSFFLGNAIPNLDHYILPIAGGIILLSFVPIVWRIVRKACSGTSSFSEITKIHKVNIDKGREMR